MQNLTSENRDFWNELCGAILAKTIGITDHSLDSLRKFDKAYFEIYPYLLEHVKVEEMRCANVLEIGLGYGSLGQKISEAGAHYVGLDIATGPVKMVKHRLKINSLFGTAIQGSMLECPFASESFDFVVSIGCFHHTGNAARCIDETYRVLKPGGECVLMLYNRFSYIRWIKNPLSTFFSFISERLTGLNSQGQLMVYDCDSSGLPAPETASFSCGQLRNMLKKFKEVKIIKENFDQFYFNGHFIPSKKNIFWDVLVAKSFGLDIYVCARK